MIVYVMIMMIYLSIILDRNVHMNLITESIEFELTIVGDINTVYQSSESFDPIWNY